MEKKILILTMGLPRSGKSTWARNKGFPIVNPDSIRLVLHGRAFVPETEPLVWVIARYMAQALFEAGHDHVIVDATNTTRKRRDIWKDEGWDRKYRVFGVDKDECIKRAVAGQRSDLVPIIERMSEAWEDIEEDEWDGQEFKTAIDEG